MFALAEIQRMNAPGAKVPAVKVEVHLTGREKISLGQVHLVTYLDEPEPVYRRDPFRLPTD